MNANHNLYIGTLSGTLLSLSALDAGDLGKSALLAAVGATVSFSVSLLLRFVANKLKEWFGRQQDCGK